jgi:hypothetical protein
MRPVSAPVPSIARSCTACGALLLLAPERISAACSYCGSNLVDDARTERSIDRVCAFRLGRRAAEERLRAHVAGAIWAPDAIRRLARGGSLRAEALHGVLVPFYRYDARTLARYRARIGLDWTRETHVLVGTRHETKRERHTEWFTLGGTTVGEWADHLECASRGLSAREVARLLPFDLGHAAAFDVRLLAGWDSELPARSRSEADGGARVSLRELAARRLAERVLPGDHVRVDHFACEVELARVDLVLVPVWIATYRHAGKPYRLLVHGQEGRCVGRPPISAAKVSVAAAAFATIVLVILWTSWIMRSFGGLS